MIEHYWEIKRKILLLLVGGIYTIDEVSFWKIKEKIMYFVHKWKAWLKYEYESDML